MASYPLDKLNDKEFEEICRDVLQKELGIRFETFRRGKDKGKDLRYSTDEAENAIVVQAKHYFRSGFQLLFNGLKNEELEKVKKFHPVRYIVMTSVPLNDSEKVKIIELFQGFIKNSGDIYGQDDINNSISRFPEILKLHPKLYLASMHVLKEVIHAHIRSRSAEKIKEIHRKIHLFVQNENYKNAIEVINREHFLIITGDPGIGKTSLANFITYQHLADGFRFTYILSDLTDAEKMLDDEEKELFYFDDFLGANYLRIKHNPHQDSMLIDLINRIKLSNNKRLILTTRTTILNQARADFEKLKNPVIDTSKHQIHISDYNELQKASILYNHIFHSGLVINFLENFLKNKSYQSIIFHPNYNPRLIEFITDASRLKGVKAEGYHDFIINKLENPEDIWLDPYESQISEAAKFLLQTLFTLPGTIAEQYVKDAFDARVEFEIKENGFQKTSNLYLKTLYELLEGFIHRKIGRDTVYLEYYNPSFGDFISKYLSSNEDETLRILKSLLYTDQFKNSFSFSKNETGSWAFNMFDIFFRSAPEKVQLSHEKIIPIILERLDYLKPLDIYKSRELDLFSFLVEYFGPEKMDKELTIFYKFIDINVIKSNQYSDLFVLLEILNFPETSIYKIVKFDFDKIMLQLFKIATDEDDFISIKNQFDYVSEDYEAFTLKYKEELQLALDDFWENGEIDSRLDRLESDEIYDVDTITSQLNEIEVDAERLNEDLGLERSPSFSQIFKRDYTELIERNIQDKNEDSYNASVIKSEFEHPINSQSEMIEAMFDNLLDGSSKSDNEELG